MTLCEKCDNHCNCKAPCAALEALINRDHVGYGKRGVFVQNAELPPGTQNDWLDIINLKEGVEMPEQTAIIGFNSLRKMWNKVDDKGNKILEGKYRESLMRAFVQETVRPLVGAMGGGAVALGLSEGQDDDALRNAIAF